MDIYNMLDQILSKTDTNRKEKIKGHYSSLLAIAYADGKLHPDEIELLTEFANKWGLSKTEISEIHKNPVPAEAPDSFKERVEFLVELAWMMVIDCEINDKELEISKTVALRYGINPNVMDYITSKLITFFDKGEVNDSSYNRLLEDLYQELKTEFV